MQIFQDVINYILGLGSAVFRTAHYFVARTTMG